MLTTRVVAFATAFILTKFFNAAQDLEVSMSQVIAQGATARFPAIVTAMPQAHAGWNATGLPLPRRPWFAFGAALMLLAACEGGVSESNATSYGQGPFWQGGICFARSKSGQMVRVAPSNCPPKAETEAPADATTTSN